MPPEQPTNQMPASSSAPTPDLPPAQTPAAMAPVAAQESPDRDYDTAILLSIFAGGFGADRFYLGRYVTAVLKLMTLGGVGIWAMIDMLLVAFGKLRQKNGLPLQGYAKYGKPVKIVVSIFVSFFIFLIVATIVIVALVAPSLQHGTRDVAAHDDLAKLSSQLSSYNRQQGSYPNAAQFHDGTFRMPLMFQFDGNAMNYSPTPAGCDGQAVICSGYSIHAKTIFEHRAYTITQ